MPTEEIAVFIPIITVLVIGLVLVTYLYYHSKERQMLIDKGLGPESIKEFFEEKRDPFRMIKLGIIIVAFGISLGLGLWLQDITGKDYWTPFSIFTITGLGFVIANVVANKMSKQQ
jgi:MFS-type transporter involved in bile tolerance (Atg22 family)